jgi:Tfp pilus assembly protein PilO
MALNKREQILLGTTIILTVLGVNYLVLVPLSRHWEMLRGQLTTNRKELEDMKKTIRLGPEWQKQYAELGVSLGQRQKFQQTSDVLKKIEEVGTTSGIQIKEKRPMQTTEKDVYLELPVQCSLESTTEALVKFLYGLQTSSGFMSVEELQVTPQPDNPSILRCSIRTQALTGKSGSPKP